MYSAIKLQTAVKRDSDSCQHEGFFVAERWNPVYWSLGYYSWKTVPFIFQVIIEPIWQFCCKIKMDVLLPSLFLMEQRIGDFRGPLLFLVIFAKVDLSIEKQVMFLELIDLLNGLVLGSISEFMLYLLQEVFVFCCMRRLHRVPFDCWLRW